MKDKISGFDPNWKLANLKTNPESDVLKKKPLSNSKELLPENAVELFS